MSRYLEYTSVFSYKSLVLAMVSQIVQRVIRFAHYKQSDTHLENVSRSKSLMHRNQFRNSEEVADLSLQQFNQAHEYATRIIKQKHYS